MDILGISCYYHDAAAVLLRDGKIVAAAEEERFTRVKHDYGFPKHAIQFCLESGGIQGQDLDHVVFFEKPFRKLDRILMSVLQTYPRSWKVFRESMITWMIDKLWVGSTIESELGVSKSKVLFCEHHLSHAASAYLCSPFDEAAILTVDGVGEWVTGTWGVGRGNEMRLHQKMEFPHSLGLLYSAFTAFLGFEVNEGEYKVMGMAPYGQPRYTDKVWKLVKPNADGSFALDMDYFSFHYSTEKTFNRRFVDLFGDPRPPKSQFFTEATGFPKYFGDAPANYSEECRLNQFYADVAASIQRVTEELLLNMANKLHQETGMKRLCMAGGVGLNSVANGRILRETPFEELYVQPAAGDGGGALGAALWAYNTLLGKAAQLHHGARLLGTLELRWRDQRFPDARTTFLTSSFDKTSSAEPRSRTADAGAKCRDGPGTLRVGAACAWESQHHRRPAQSGDEGHREREDQVPRALSSVCAFGPGGASGEVFRAAQRDEPPSGALHAICGAGKRRAKKRHCRPSRTWMVPVVCKRCSRRRARAITS